jgi:penicillin-binding protein 2
MIEQTDGRRPPVSQGMALRVAVLGGIGFALFAIIFFRLWYLQVLSGDQYLAQANDNRIRVERDPAPRGSIVDRTGVVLVENRKANVVALKPSTLPSEVLDAAAEYGQKAGQREQRPKGRKGAPVPFPPLRDPALRDRYARLGRVIGLPASEIHRRVISSLVQAPYATIRLKTDVPNTVRDFLVERHDEFPGVDPDVRFLRKYNYGGLAAQIFGPIGEISPDQLKMDRFRDLRQGQVIGKDGLEYTYDRYLRGRDGTRKVVVGADNKPRSTIAGREPVAGKQLKLTLDLGLQQSLQNAMVRMSGGLPGGAVALDPRSGEILAMVSLPTFDPAVLARPISKDKFDERFGEDAGAPLVNRALSGLYPTGSTFKPITALAALQTGVATAATTIADSGCQRIGTLSTDVVCNAGKTAFGSVNVQRALTVSSNVFFYNMGLRLNPLEGQPLQKWAARLGLGRPTGVDLPGDVEGLVPSAEWRRSLNRREAACRRKKGIELAAGTYSSCGISDLREWTAGDEVNLSVGQGDLQVTPLQLAVAYSTIANGGTVVRPHLGLAVEDEQGRTEQRLRPGRTRKVRIDEANRQLVLAGLNGAASEPGGTSSAVFDGWDQARRPMHGKTGTAQRVQDGGMVEQSWYASYAFEKDANGKPTRPIVIVATVEKGGYGAARAAPAVCSAMWKWFTGKGRTCKPGDNATL